MSPALISVTLAVALAAGQDAMFTKISQRVYPGKDYRASITLADGRAHFNHLHAAHMGHPGIPTHRLTVTFRAKSKARKVPVRADIEVMPPKGEAIKTSLWREDGQLVADLELTATGSYRFRLTVPERGGKRDFRWTETLR